MMVMVAVVVIMTMSVIVVVVVMMGHSASLLTFICGNPSAPGDTDENSFHKNKRPHGV
jgi:hypothetical protein